MAARSQRTEKLDLRLTPKAKQTISAAAEDRAMLEQLRTTATPLDLTAEVHTRADRSTVEMRKVLADLVDLGS